MATRVTPVGTKISSDTLGFADYDDCAGGWLGHVVTASDQGPLTHSNDALSALTVTVTVGTSRRIKITGYARFLSSTTQDDANLQIEESGTVLEAGSTTLIRSTTSYVIHIAAVITPSAGSHTYNLTGGLAGGTGPVTMKASSTSPAWILIEDIGPA